uniref:Uncharacterized protein n=1 Tax=Junco hyemalis TaxID=40217 RepID=A0A8C5JQ25_JUNHY
GCDPQGCDPQGGDLQGPQCCPSAPQCCPSALQCHPSAPCCCPSAPWCCPSAPQCYPSLAKAPALDQPGCGITPGPLCWEKGSSAEGRPMGTQAHTHRDISRASRARELQGTNC